MIYEQSADYYFKSGAQTALCWMMLRSPRGARVGISRSARSLVLRPRKRCPKVSEGLTPLLASESPADGDFVAVHLFQLDIAIYGHTVATRIDCVVLLFVVFLKSM